MAYTTKSLQFARKNNKTYEKILVTAIIVEGQTDLGLGKSLSCVAEGTKTIACFFPVQV